MSISKKLISNTVYLFLDWLIATSMSFLYWLIAGKTLLPEEYGIVSTTTNLAIVLSNISLLGLNTAVWKLIPEYQARREYGKIISIIRFSLKIVTISALSFSFALILFSPFIQTAIKIPLAAILLSAITLFLISISSQFGMIIYAFQEMKKFLLSDSFSQLTKVLLSAILIFLGFKYFGPIIGFLLSFLVLALIRLFLIPLKGKSKKIDEKKVIFDFAFPAFISNISWVLFINGQYVLLTILKSTEATGLLTIALILTSPIAVIPNTLTSALLPIIS
ncbi:MAG: oligosaccharide flippase family protein, partial [Candidatus Aenigmatarchaeota archaeon]